MTVEAEKFHHLPSESWRPGKPVVWSVHIQRSGNQGSWQWTSQVKVKGRRTWGLLASVLESKGLRTGRSAIRGQETDVCTQTEREFTVPQPYYSKWALHGCDDAHPCWWGWIFFTQSAGPHAHLSSCALTDTPRDDALPATWASLSPVRLTLKIDYHSSNNNNKAKLSVCAGQLWVSLRMSTCLQRDHGHPKSGQAQDFSFVPLSLAYSRQVSFLLPRPILS